MSVLLPVERALLNLEEDVSIYSPFLHMDKAAAVEILKRATGQDFGYDPIQWRKWIFESSLIDSIAGNNE